MALSVTDSFSNRVAHVEEALSILGRSERRWEVFLAIYKGKKKRKSVEVFPGTWRPSRDKSETSLLVSSSMVAAVVGAMGAAHTSS